MAHKLVVRSKLPVQVKGSLTGEDGKPVEFNFTLKCKRLNQAQIDAAMNNKGESVNQFLHNVTEGWEDMLGEDGNPLPFSAQALDEVLDNDAGMSVVCFQSYLKAAGATLKN